MRVFLRQSSSGLLFQEPDQWTSDGLKARVFKHSAEAMDTARAKGLDNVEVLLAFDEEAALADAEAAIAALHRRTAAQLAMLDEALPALAQALPGTDSS